MSDVRRVLAWEALDSRGAPTVACLVVGGSGASGQAIAPAGASTGTHEAHELRDGGPRYGGRGVLRAIEHVNTVIGPALVGQQLGEQQATDDALRALDGSLDLSRLGANAILAVSLAYAKASAADAGQPLHEWARAAEPVLPLPMVNIISGGAHAGGLVDIQDVLVVPVGASSFAEAVEWAVRVRTAAAELARKRGLSTTLVADEGGLAFPLGSNREAVELVAQAIEHAGLRPGEDAAIAIDIAASGFFELGGYKLAAEGRVVSAVELVAELAEWAAAYPIVSYEDPVAEDDWEGWQIATQELSELQLLGDDFLVTNLQRLELAIERGLANAVLVKPNQIGTLSDALAVTERARAAGYATVLSARSGDTEEDWLADISVAWATGQIKVGSTTRSERTAKWNRLLGLEAELGLPFAGRGALATRRP